MSDKSDRALIVTSAEALESFFASGYVLVMAPEPQHDLSLHMPVIHALMIEADVFGAEEVRRDLA